MDDKRIVDLLFMRDEAALWELERQYRMLYRKLLSTLLDSTADVDECSNDLLSAVWSSIPPNRPDHLPSYICKLARRIGINRLKYNKREKRSTASTVMLSELSECVPDNSFSEEMESEERAEAIRRTVADFVKELDSETRVLFVRRYFYAESVKELSKRFGMSENAISVRLHRVRARLKLLLEKEDIHV